MEASTSLECGGKPERDTALDGHYQQTLFLELQL
jgi:hypothetical protein